MGQSRQLVLSLFMLHRWLTRIKPESRHTKHQPQKSKPTPWKTELEERRWHVPGVMNALLRQGRHVAFLAAPWAALAPGVRITELLKA
ncbi:hypothetical protein Y1Q_0003453 [Alligator mississippiensis]|uniref:Uncharacterized protein n=1 Tax=Alligator mississippiensis TaxID=8496 RepID=A0A151M4C2_ALLMI|nr:hypothetical protein Y1Q_0003453 [Alligator mississippiensis]